MISFDEAQRICDLLLGGTKGAVVFQEDRHVEVDAPFEGAGIFDFRERVGQIKIAAQFVAGAAFNDLVEICGFSEGLELAAEFRAVGGEIDAQSRADLQATDLNAVGA